MNGLWKVLLPGAGMVLATAACGDGGDDGEGTLTASPIASVLEENTPPAEDRSDNNGDGEPTCTPETYEVQSGDTLSAIAVEFDVSVEAIAEASGVEDPNVLAIGQELTIPCPGQGPATPNSEEAAAESPTPEP